MQSVGSDDAVLLRSWQVVDRVVWHRLHRTAAGVTSTDVGWKSLGNVELKVTTLLNYYLYMLLLGMLNDY